MGHSLVSFNSLPKCHLLTEAKLTNLKLQSLSTYNL